jgi:helicase MOV-10
VCNHRAITRRTRSFARRFSLNRAVAGSVSVRSNVPITVRLCFTSSFRGRYQDRLEFVFEDRSINQQFVIIRNIHAIAGERADHASMQPSAPYIPRKWMPRTREVEVIPGVRPPALTSIPWVVSLPDAFVPNALSETVASGSVKDILERLRRSFLPASFNHQTYGRHWKNLLWVEEIRMECAQTFKPYNSFTYVVSSERTFVSTIWMMQVCQHTRHTTSAPRPSDGTLMADRPYSLQVPGLAEKRPSVLVGECTLYRKLYNSDSRSRRPYPCSALRNVGRSVVCGRCACGSTGRGRTPFQRIIPGPYIGFEV